MKHISVMFNEVKTALRNRQNQCVDRLYRDVGMFGSWVCSAIILQVRSWKVLEPLIWTPYKSEPNENAHSHQTQICCWLIKQKNELTLPRDGIQTFHWSTSFTTASYSNNPPLSKQQKQTEINSCLLGVQPPPQYRPSPPKTKKNNHNNIRKILKLNLLKTLREYIMVILKPYFLHINVKGCLLALSAWKPVFDQCFPSPILVAQSFYLCSPYSLQSSVILVLNCG